MTATVSMVTAATPVAGSSAVRRDAPSNSWAAGASALQIRYNLRVAPEKRAARQRLCWLGSRASVPWRPMTKRSSVVTLGRGIVLAASLLWAVGACSSKSHSSSAAHLAPDAGGTTADAGCTPGETQDCRFQQLCDGTQLCQPDGSFGPCECSSVPNDGSSGIVGAKCESDADCLGGGTCMTAAGTLWAGQGGPAGGYCTYQCQSDTDCTTHDKDSACEPAGPNGASYCIRTCLSKDPEPGEAKCLNRPDLVCQSAAAAGQEFVTANREQGYCLPLCGSDEECPTGRVCHRQGGVCTTFPAPGSPTGSACTLSTNCDGEECENRDSGGVGTCTANCVVGALSGCGYAADAPLRKAGCLSVQVAADEFSEGVGDLGFCRELCDVDSDCTQAAHGFVCRPITPALAAFVGRTGACVQGSASTSN
jgi:hypothetical protein